MIDFTHQIAHVLKVHITPFFLLYYNTITILKRTIIFPEKGFDRIFLINIFVELIFYDINLIKKYVYLHNQINEKRKYSIFQILKTCSLMYENQTIVFSYLLLLIFLFIRLSIIIHEQPGVRRSCRKGSSSFSSWLFEPKYMLKSQFII